VVLRTRDALITESDVYAPRRGELALTVPLFARYLLTHYEHARSHATTSLATPESIRRNLQATRSAPSPDASPPDDALIGVYREFVRKPR
jgi:hypothetical protein